MVAGGCSDVQIPHIYLVSFLCLAPCCTVLRPRWYQNGIRVVSEDRGFRVASSFVLGRLWMASSSCAHRIPSPNSVPSHRLPRRLHGRVSASGTPVAEAVRRTGYDLRTSTLPMVQDIARGRSQRLVNREEIAVYSRLRVHGAILLGRRLWTNVETRFGQEGRF